MFNHQNSRMKSATHKKKEGKGENKYSHTQTHKRMNITMRARMRWTTILLAMHRAKARLIFIPLQFRFMLHVCCPVVIASCWPIVYACFLIGAFYICIYWMVYIKCKYSIWSFKQRRKKKPNRIRKANRKRAKKDHSHSILLMGYIPSVSIYLHRSQNFSPFVHCNSKLKLDAEWEENAHLIVWRIGRKDKGATEMIILYSKWHAMP